MRCPTCGDSAHPGYVTWRDVDLGGGLYRRSAVPCPDCGGSVIVSCCDGAVGSFWEAIGAADVLVESDAD
jgi:hypothetical protein